MAFNHAGSRIVCGIEMSQPSVWYGAHDDMLETRLLRVGGDTGTGLPNPLAHTSITIVIEAVHAVGSHSVLFRIAVPTFPDGGGAIIHGVEPTGVLALEE